MTVALKRSLDQLLFQSTRDSIQAEKLCGQIPVASKVVPVPNSISSECGIAIRIHKADLAKVERAITEAGIHVEAHCGGENEEPSFDLLSTTEYGGCSAKLSPDQLAQRTHVTGPHGRYKGRVALSAVCAHRSSLLKCS